MKNRSSEKFFCRLKLGSFLMRKFFTLFLISLMIGCASSKINNDDAAYLGNSGSILYRLGDDFFGAKYDKSSRKNYLYEASDDGDWLYRYTGPQVDGEKVQIGILIRYGKVYKDYSIEDGFYLDLERLNKKISSKSDAKMSNEYRVRENEQHIREQKDRDEQNKYFKIYSKEFVEKRKEIDLVAKVLNFSSGMGDYGFDDQYWAPKIRGMCVYKIYPKPDERMFVGKWHSDQSISGVGTFLPNYKVREIDLNTIDPSSIRIKHQIQKNLFGVVEVVTVVSANEQNLFVTPGRLDLIRLQNGWSKIFHGQCRGRRREF